MTLALATLSLGIASSGLGLFALGRWYERANTDRARLDAFAAGRRSMLVQGVLLPPFSPPRDPRE